MLLWPLSRKSASSGAYSGVPLAAPVTSMFSVAVSSTAMWLRSSHARTPALFLPSLVFEEEARPQQAAWIVRDAAQQRFVREPALELAAGFARFGRLHGLSLLRFACGFAGLQSLLHALPLRGIGFGL